MDREAIARAVRRRQAQETLDFEREREQTLNDQVELVIAEAEGANVDAAAFAKMSPQDVQIVKTELDPPGFGDGDDDGPGFFERDDLFDLDEFEDDIDPHAEELARLNSELAECRRRQEAFAAYIEALDALDA